MTGKQRVVDKETWPQRFNRLWHDAQGIETALNSAVDQLYSASAAGMTMRTEEYRAIKNAALAIAHWAHARAKEQKAKETCQ